MDRPTAAQFRKLTDQTLTPMVRTLERLRQRLTARGYGMNDEYKRLVDNAQVALQSLIVATSFEAKRKKWQAIPGKSMREVNEGFVDTGMR